MRGRRSARAPVVQHPSCARKRSYVDEATAKLVSDRYNDRHAKKRASTVYLCRFCNLYHLTHATNEKRHQARFRRLDKRADRERK